MEPEKPILLLVPGICHGASYFDDTKTRFEALGYRVLCRSNPSLNDATKTWSDDRDALLELIGPELAAGEEIFVITHSYGSAPGIALCEDQSINERAAAGKKGGIRGIVIIASGVVTEKGDSVVGKFGGAWPPYCSPNKEKDDGLAYPNPTAARSGFYSDIEDAAAAKLVARLKPISIASVTDPITYVGTDLKVPTFFLQTEKDEAFPIQYQKMICAELPGVITAAMHTGHSPYLSKPDEFVRQMVKWIEMKA